MCEQCVADGKMTPERAERLQALIRGEAELSRQDIVMGVLLASSAGKAAVQKFMDMAFVAGWGLGVVSDEHGHYALALVRNGDTSTTVELGLISELSAKALEAEAD